jgi:uncharacterized protein
VALDLDNTIVPWHTDRIADGVRAWLDVLRASSIGVCLITNNYGAQAKDVARALDLALVRGALKPMPAAFSSALRALKTDAEHAVAIGDQLFTDVLGAKLLGMRAIYVQPIDRREFVTTRFLRMLERPVFARLQHRAER